MAKRGAHKPGEIEDLTIVVGRKPVLELLSREPHRAETVLLDKERQSRELEDIRSRCLELGVKVSMVPSRALEALYAGGHQGVAARLFSAGFVPLEPLLELGKQSVFPVLLALDQVQDTHNTGTLARSLFGLGGGGLILPKHGGAALGAGAMKASAGTLMRLPVAKETNLAKALEQAAESGYTIVGAGKGGISGFEMKWPGPLILVLGNEDKGLRPSVQERCSHIVTLPLYNDLDSFNVAQAGAMLMALAARQLCQRI